MALCVSLVRVAREGELWPGARLSQVGIAQGIRSVIFSHRLTGMQGVIFVWQGADVNAVPAINRPPIAAKG